ncbi:T9SS type A sorting domain-containing protein [Winogradskyella pulchriflava]|uniref:T9SS type A sorting domain-containing protein n=1 Tax=Winogradskyella pulchriflava TaxID=1110688 RepID=A0ABV6Q8P8_9FLAO
MKKNYFGLIALLICGFAFGQTTIFDHAGGGSAPAGWTFNNNVTTNAIDRGSYWLVDAGGTSDEIITSSIDLSAYSSAEFSLSVASFGTGSHNQALIEISFDGGTNYTQTETSPTTTGSSYINGGSFTLNTLSSTVVIKISNTGSSGRGVRLQDLVLTAEAATTNTQVQFTSASATVGEADGTYDLTFSITNEDATNATTFDVVLTAGEAADINSYSTQSVTFPAGSSTNETLTVTITDDAFYEGDETLTFSIQNISGGNSAAAGANSSFDLTIADNDPDPSIVIFIEDFDNTNPKWNNDIESQLFVDPSTPSEGLFIQAASSNNINFSGNTVFGRDLEGESGEPSLAPYTFTFESVDVSDFTSLVVSFDYHAFANAETGEYEIVIDGVGQGQVEYFNDPDSSPGVNGTISVPVADGANTIGLILTGTLNGGSDVIEFDNFTIKGIYNGLVFVDGVWNPAAPSAATAALDALVLSGTYTVTTDIAINNMVVKPGANIIIDPIFTLTSNSLTLESTSSSYSSLISNGTIIGTINYHRFTNTVGTGATGTGGNDLISVPLHPTVLGGLTFDTFLTQGSPANSTKLASQTTIVTTYAFGPYNNTSLVPAYENYDSNSTDVLEIAKGYRAATTTGENLTFTGIPLQANQSIMLTNPLTGGSQWNLIGNPFASYVDAQAWLTANSAILDSEAVAIYGYNSGTYSGSEATVNNFTIINSSANNSLNIAPGQAFFVAAGPGDLSGNAGSVVFAGNDGFPADMRITTGNDDFIEGRTTNENYHLKLELTGTNSETTNFYFNNNSSRGLDPGYDAATLDAFTSEHLLYSHLVEDNTGRAMAINSLSVDDMSDVTIPLGVNSNQGEQLTFSINTSTLPDGISVYLDDTFANTSTLLNSADYVLTPSTDLNGTGRFYLRLANSALSTADTRLDELTIYTNQTDRTIVIAGQLTEDTTAYVYDIQGRLVTTQQLNNQSGLQTIDAHTLYTGVYIVKLSSGNSNRVEKVILK